MEIKNFLKTHQQTIVLVIGYGLVTALGFGLGRVTTSTQAAPEIRVEEAFLPPNDTANAGLNQSGENPIAGAKPSPAPTPASVSGQDCANGQIKGNIGSNGSRVYHMPGGSFYNRTKAEQCFGTETEALAAGFRKSNN